MDFIFDEFGIFFGRNTFFYISATWARCKFRGSPVLVWIILPNKKHVLFPVKRFNANAMVIFWQPTWSELIAASYCNYVCPQSARVVKEEMEFINETCLTAELRSAAVHEALACALLQHAAPTSAVSVPTQITKPVKVAQTKLVLEAGTRSSFSFASCNCPKYSKFKHQHTFFLMYADLCNIFAAASLFRIRAVHYCIICPYLG